MGQKGFYFDITDANIKAYLFYATILIAKTIAMSLITARFRMQKRIFISEEDTTILKKSKVSYNDPDIERVRRAHLNDLENIVMFLFTGFIYILTNPNVWIALTLFRVYTISRILHTIVYLFVVPQPARAVTFGIAWSINLYMLVVSALTFY